MNSSMPNGTVKLEVREDGRIKGIELDQLHLVPHS